jgi:excisionase family DNA binding protein
MDTFRLISGARSPGSGERLLTVPEVSERLAISERKVWGLLAEKRLRRIRVGRATRIRASDLENLIAELTAPGEHP